jgi:diguanylate cyclase (GGDEF)-like protein/PAS domain S-box-containing protein
VVAELLSTHGSFCHQAAARHDENRHTAFIAGGCGRAGGRCHGGGLGGELEVLALEGLQGSLVAEEDDLAVGLRADLGTQGALSHGRATHWAALFEDDTAAVGTAHPQSALANVREYRIAVGLVDPALDAGIALHESGHGGLRLANQRFVGRRGGTTGKHHDDGHRDDVEVACSLEHGLNLGGGRGAAIPVKWRIEWLGRSIENITSMGWRCRPLASCSAEGFMKLTGSYALKVALVYAAVSVLWILFSDSAVEWLTGNNAALSAFRDHKWWLFVMASSLLVFWLSWRALAEQGGLIRSLRQSAIVFERTHEGVVITDHRNRILEVNPSFSRMAGRSEVLLRGVDLATLHSSRHDVGFFDDIRSCIGEQGYWTGEIWNVGPDGSERPYQATVTYVGSGRDGQDRYAWIFTEITKLKDAQKRLEDLAYHDALTGLPSRLQVGDRLRQLLAEAKAEPEVDRRIAVLYIDLDHFRNVNDSFGHPVGDNLLVLVARRLQGRLPEGAGLAHLGGDEFLIYLENVTDSGQAGECAVSMLKAIAEPFVLANRREVYVRASIGIAFYPDDAGSATELLQYSNAAMFEAKKLGRNNWQYFSRQLVRRADQRLQLDTRLRRALEREEFTLHYMPIMGGGEAEEVSGVEALLRWEQPDKTLMAPEEFVAAAEETGLIVPLGRWVLEQACLQAALWQRQLDRPIPVAVNLSAQQFRTGRLFDHVECALEQSGLPPQLLHLEITESMLMEQIQTGQNLLGRLRQLGVHMSLDDFGTGYSSLSYLRRFDVDTLKIDQSFITDLVGNAADRDLVSAIISMAHCLRLKVVGEGVEQVEQLEVLRSLGCDCFQGYFFSPPLPPEQLVNWLKEGASHRAIGTRSGADGHRSGSQQPGGS